MKLIRIPALLAALLSFPVFAGAASSPAPAAETPAKSKKESTFAFSLLPKSLQKNPRLDFNIITEMTPEGKKWPVPTKERPIYYISQAGGVYNAGVGVDHNVKAPPVEKLQQMMEKSLAEAGYRLSDDSDGHAPGIVVIYHWGSHTFQPDAEVTDDSGASVNPQSEVQIRKALLDRAKLLGGPKFVKEVLWAFEQVDQRAMLQRNSAPTGDASFMGGTADAIRDPFEELRSRSTEMERLVEELFSSSFFVVASAYDYVALAQKQRRLLWRTKMTVNSLGVNMLESVPGLIASAGPYFGRDLPDPILITKRVSREGKVEVGTPTVVPDAKPPAK